MAEAKRDNNMITTLIGVSSADGITPVTIYVDPITHRVLTSAAAGGPAGSDTQVQFNDGGVMAGDSGLTFNKTTNVLSAGGVLISGLTASEIVITDASKNLVSAAVATYPSLTELTYVKGVTSAIQTQITAKAPSTSPTFATSITGSYLTASEILITDASKNIISAAVATYPSLTELTYVKGVTSAIQTQLNNKAAALGADDNYVTDAEKVIIGNTSGTNTGDNSANSLYSGLAASKADVGQTFYIGTTQVAINRTSAALILAGITLTTPDIGTPLAGIATNITGLVPANIVAGTLAAKINLGEGADPATIGLEIDASMSADERYSGITVPGTAGATLAFGDLCYLDVTATEWLLADASAASTSGDVVLGICVDASTDGAATSMLLLGTVRSAAFPASIALGAPVYISETAGDITATQPTTTDAVIRRVGFAVTAEPNTIYFSPSNDFITHT